MPPPARPAILVEMRTIKDDLDRRARRFARVAGVCLAGFVLACTALILGWKEAGIPGVIAFMVAWVTIFAFGVVGVRCPRCGERLEMFYHRELWLSGDFRYCPQCGLDFQTPTEDNPAG